MYKRSIDLPLDVSADLKLLCPRKLRLELSGGIQQSLWIALKALEPKINPDCVCGCS